MESLGRHRFGLVLGVPSYSESATKWKSSYRVFQATVATEIEVEKLQHIDRRAQVVHRNVCAGVAGPVRWDCIEEGKIGRRHWLDSSNIGTARKSHVSKENIFRLSCKSSDHLVRDAPERDSRGSGKSGDIEWLVIKLLSS